MKKSYNPFKMFGSYLGAILLFLSTLIELSIPQTLFAWIPLLNELTIPNGDSSVSIWYNMKTAIIGDITVIILGFIIGWGIHSLIRKLRK